VEVARGVEVLRTNTLHAYGVDLEEHYIAAEDKASWEDLDCKRKHHNEKEEDRKDDNDDKGHSGSTPFGDLEAPSSNSRRKKR
jgi:hypothetical protein